MSKRQLGLRIDRILYEQFKEVLARDELRLSEAVEALVRLAVEAGGVTSLVVDHSKHVDSGSMINDALFRSRLSRLKTAIELEERLWKETGEESEQEETESGYWTGQLTELARKPVSPDLAKEFEACLSESDKFYREVEKFNAEERICRHKARIKD